MTPLFDTKANPQSTISKKPQLTIQQRLRRGKEFLPNSFRFEEKFSVRFQTRRNPAERLYRPRRRADALDARPSREMKAQEYDRQGPFL
jgi:hypothetical protein